MNKVTIGIIVIIVLAILGFSFMGDSEVEVSENTTEPETAEETEEDYTDLQTSEDDFEAIDEALELLP